VWLVGPHTPDGPGLVYKLSDREAALSEDERSADVVCYGIAAAECIYNYRIDDYGRAERSDRRERERVAEFPSGVVVGFFGR
jgi:hypothetical protein